MQQPDSLNLVAEFHTTFKHPILPAPAIPAENRCKLRVALLAEELKELEVAILEKDIVGIADAFCDLQYVLSGAILEFGLGDKFKALFDEVQRSNMSKACTSEAEAKATVEHYLKRTAPSAIINKQAISGWFIASQTVKQSSLWGILLPARMELWTADLHVKL